MKMIYGGVPVQSLKVKHYEMDTNSATVQPSDLHSGITCYARGKKVTGTGRSFDFANYGSIYTNVATIIPSVVNVVEVASLTYPVQLSMALTDMKNVDFSNSQTIANIIVDGEPHTITVVISDGKMTLVCDKTMKLQIFYGKDNYV